MVMSETAIGIWGIVALFFCLVARLPVGMALLVVGFGGIWVLDGQRAAIATMSSETYSSITAYPLSIIPLFVLMGNMAGAAGYSQRLYEAAYAWVGRLRGGLASSTVLGCAAFAAVSGSSVATAVTIGKVALPEMKRFGYADGLATGLLRLAGRLGFSFHRQPGLFSTQSLPKRVSVGCSSLGFCLGSCWRFSLWRSYLS